MYVFANGTELNGYFFEGKIAGFGRCIFYNGDIYEGQYVDEQYSGDGKYRFEAARIMAGFYIGEFKDGAITGNGKFNLRSLNPLAELFGPIRIVEIEEEYPA